MKSMHRMLTACMTACIVLVLPFAILGEHWYTYTIAGILTPVAFISTWIMCPSKEDKKA